MGLEPTISTLGKSHVDHYTKPANDISSIPEIRGIVNYLHRLKQNLPEAQTVSHNKSDVEKKGALPQPGLASFLPNRQYGNPISIGSTEKRFNYSGFSLPAY
jgi:hypothetical protein